MIFTLIYKLIEANLGIQYTTRRIEKLCEEQTLEFTNWTHIEGWCYGINGMYIKEDIYGVKLQLSPKELYDYYKNEVQENDKNKKKRKGI